MDNQVKACTQILIYVKLPNGFEFLMARPQTHDGSPKLFSSFIRFCRQVYECTAGLWMKNCEIRLSDYETAPAPSIIGLPVLTYDSLVELGYLEKDEDLTSPEWMLYRFTRAIGAYPFGDRSNPLIPTPEPMHGSEALRLQTNHVSEWTTARFNNGQ